MVTMLTTSELHFRLVKEALTNHGFQFKESMTRKYWFFGKVLYKVTVDYVPRLHFLEKILQEAIDAEDYVNAEGIQRIIDIKKGLL